MFGFLQHLKPAPHPPSHPGSANSLEELRLRPLRYETADGACEIGWGSALVLFALSSYAFVLLPPALAWRNPLGWLLLAAAASAPYLTQRTIKRAVTWPRTGYVGYRHDTRKQRGILVLVGVVAGGIAAALPFMGPPSSTAGSASLSNADTGSSTGLASLGLAAVFAVPNAILYLMLVAARIREHRWKWMVLGLITTVPFAVALAAPGEWVPQSRPTMLYLGLAWLASGVLTLVSYLKHAPAPLPPSDLE